MDFTQIKKAGDGVLRRSINPRRQYPALLLSLPQSQWTGGQKIAGAIIFENFLNL
jgi:hypothetical protein